MRSPRMISWLIYPELTSIPRGKVRRGISEIYTKSSYVHFVAITNSRLLFKNYVIS